MLLLDSDATRSKRTVSDFLALMVCGGVSKTVATTLAYPHEVARTRLREAGTKYSTFWGTLATVHREEGMVGLYRGLGTNLVRQIPNTAVMMATYEVTQVPTLYQAGPLDVEIRSEELLKAVLLCHKEPGQGMQNASNMS